MNILVTGSEGGIGRAVVARLTSGGKHNVVRYDPWAQPSVMPEWPAHVLAQCERVVVCQGINYPVTPGTAPESIGISSVMWEANVFSIVALARNWVGARKQAGEGPGTGRNAFIVVTSNSAEIARSRSLDYCAGKAAIDMALRVMQRDHVREGFEFHSVEAGHVDTPMFERMSGILGADVMRAGYMRSPLQRLISPEELAGYIHYLCTEPSAIWLSGRGVRFDGGEQ